jgi:deazaflavin-dependent oxidoreductase (nitroreductase family)
MSDYNARIIEEFRANDGHVGGDYEHMPLVLLHHRGRKTGEERVNPAAYLEDPDDPDTIYVFATKGGAPTNPGWYYNLVSGGRARVERGTDEYDVVVDELTGEERDRVYAEQVRRVPRFAGYEEQTAGLRTIPVLRLRRA